MKQRIEGIEDDIQELQGKIVKVETTLDYHNNELKELTKVGALLEKQLLNIVDTMNKIKNYIIGGISMFLLMQLGLVEFIKLFI